MRQHLYTVLLFLAVVAVTLVLALGGLFTMGAIQQRNQMGAAALSVIRQVEQGCAVSVQPAPPATPMPIPQPEGGEPQQ